MGHGHLLFASGFVVGVEPCLLEARKEQLHWGSIVAIGPRDDVGDPQPLQHHPRRDAPVVGGSSQD